MPSITAQRTSRDPCLVTLPRRTVVSDSVCLGVSPAQEHNAGADRNRVHVTDLGDQDRGHGRADPVDRLDRPIAAMAAQPAADLRLEHRDLTVVELDQVTQRLDPDRVRITELHLDRAARCRP